MIARADLFVAPKRPPAPPGYRWAWSLKDGWELVSENPEPKLAKPNVQHVPPFVVPDPLEE